MREHMPMERLTWEQVRRRRLARNGLAEPWPEGGIVEALRAVGGVQGQIMGAAELAISARVSGLTRAAVRSALWSDRTLVKTWTVRGTLHLHPTGELALWLAARRASRWWADGEWYQAEGLTRREGHRVLAAISDALDGRALTRSRLAETVGAQLGGRVAERLGSGWAHLLGPAAVAGVLCHGAPSGATVTFVRPDQWLGEFSNVDPAEALREIARRYVSTYGPATPHTFREWFYLENDESKALFESLAPELREVDVEGARGWMLADEEDDGVWDAFSARLLGEYDCYVMGFREREQLFSEAARARTKAHGKGRLEGPAPVPWVFVDGMASATWTRSRTGGSAEVTVDPFRPLTRTESAAVRRDAERVRRFLDS
jgi:winged helix DNA-binding protein